jgi:hypothetical protein
VTTGAVEAAIATQRLAQPVERVAVVIERVGRDEHGEKAPHRLGGVSGEEHAADGAPVELVGREELDQVHDDHRRRDAVHQSTGTKIERTRSPGTYIRGSRVRSTRITSSRYSSVTTMRSAAVSAPDRDARDDGRLGVDGRLAGGARADHGVLVEQPTGWSCNHHGGVSGSGSGVTSRTAAACGDRDVGETPLRRAGTVGIEP